MLHHLFGYEAKRKRCLRKAPPGVLKEFLSIPFPDIGERVDAIPILAVDFETTGLSPAKDQILSIGHIGIENNEIRLASACHTVIQTCGDLAEENVVIHQITDDIKYQGESIRDAVEDLLQALAGKVMLVHFARIEKSFLEKACVQLYGMAPVFPIIDTLMIAKRRLDKRSVPYDPSELRLFTLRERYSLPRYNAHNALSDALATAELFFAEVGKMSGRNAPALKSVLL
jgi:DNA polymerase-3 subunit epsilon